jgi:hypothetical protein
MAKDQDVRIAALETALSTTQLALNGLALRVAALEGIGAVSASSSDSILASATPGLPSRPTGKYAVLTDWLLAPSQRARRAINATFDEVEQILGFPLPESAYNYQPYWQGLPNPLARAVLAAGWKVTSLSLVGKTLVFQKVTK